MPQDDRQAGIYKILADRMKERRARSGLTANALAMKADVTRETISRIEAGRFQPRAGTLKSICVAMSVSSDYLLGLAERDSEVPIYCLPLLKVARRLDVKDVATLHAFAETLARIRYQ